MGRKVGSIDYTPFVLLGALGIGAYFLYTKFFGSGGNAANNQSIDQGTAQSVASDIASQQAAGAIQTLSNAEASGIATQLYNLGIGSKSQTDQDKMVRLIIQANTELDLLTIEKFFATKQAASSVFSTCYTLGIGCQSYDLATWLGTALDQQHLATVNNYFSSIGVYTSF